jgi:hypothetical protein
MKLERNIIHLNCGINELQNFLNSVRVEAPNDGDDSTQSILQISDTYDGFSDMLFCDSVFLYYKKEGILVVNYAASFLSEIINIDLSFLEKFVKMVKGDFYFSICGRMECVIYAKYIDGLINYERVSIENWDTNEPLLLNVAEIRGFKKVKGKFNEKKLDDLKYEVFEGLSQPDSDEYSLLLAPMWYKELYNVE